MLLVTGATSHTGKIFLNLLEEKKYSGKIRCLVRDRSKIDWLKSLSLEIEIFLGDLNETDSLVGCFKEVKTILNIAGIHFTLILLELGKKEHVDWFICVHTTGLYSKFKTASKKYKKIEESISKQSSCVTIIRPTMIYGGSNDKNMWNLINYLDNNYVFPIFGSGKNLFQPIFAGDLADAYYKVLSSRNAVIGKNYNLSGGSEISYNSILQIISSQLNRKNLYIRIPIWFSLVLLYFYKFLKKNGVTVSKEQILRMKEDKIFSYQKAKNDFGFDPISFNKGIIIEIKEYKKLKNNQPTN